MSDQNEIQMVAARPTYPAGLMPTLEVVQAEQKLSRWFAEQKIIDWEIGDCASRHQLISMTRDYTSLYRRLHTVIDMARSWVEYELTDEQFKEASFSVLHELDVRRRDGKAILEAAGEL